MRRALAWMAAPLAVLSSCSLFLSFDDLTGGGTSFGGSGGGAGEAGMPGSGGGAGGSAGDSTGGSGVGGSGGSGPNTCGTDCDDDDPCTRDSCDDSVVPARCVNEYEVGVVPDGFSEEIEADTIYRMTMAGGGAAFYLSVFAEDAGQPTTTLYRFEDEGSLFETMFSTGSWAQTARPLSAMGMLVDTSSGFALHAYLGVSDAAGTSGRVDYLRFATLKDPPVSTTVGLSYALTAPRRYPRALMFRGEPHAAWIAANGTIEMYRPGQPLNLVFNSASTGPLQADAATTMAMLSSVADVGQARPGVMFSQLGGGVFAQLDASAAANMVTECQDASGLYTDMQAVDVRIGGVWLSNWTKIVGGTDGAVVGTESKGVYCVDASCFSDLCSADLEDDFDIGVYHSASASMRREQDPPGVVFIAGASPVSIADGSGQVRTTLYLGLFQADFGVPPMEPEVEGIAAFEVASSPSVGDGAGGVDEPALVLLPPNRLALAWIQPNEERTGDVAHIERYEICLPQP